MVNVTNVVGATVIKGQGTGTILNDDVSLTADSRHPGKLIASTFWQDTAAVPLPAATPLSTAFPHPAGAFDQLERVEHMRVLVSSRTVSGPGEGLVSETLGTAAIDGSFYGVVTGLPRPFREPGIQAPDPPATGSIPPIPRWDANPERIRVESAGINGQPALGVTTHDVVGPLVGPLDYASRSYHRPAGGREPRYPDGQM